MAKRNNPEEVEKHSYYVMPGEVVFPKKGEKCLDKLGNQWRLLKSHTHDGSVIWQMYGKIPNGTPSDDKRRWYNCSLIVPEVLQQYAAWVN